MDNVDKLVSWTRPTTSQKVWQTVVWWLLKWAAAAGWALSAVPMTAAKWYAQLYNAAADGINAVTSKVNAANQRFRTWRKWWTYEWTTPTTLYNAYKNAAVNASINWTPIVKELKRQTKDSFWNKEEDSKEEHDEIVAASKALLKANGFSL